MKLKKIFTAMVTALALCSYVAAADATDIMRQVYDRKKPNFTKAALQMTLTDKNGTKETRNVGEYGRCRENLTDMVMIFFSPAAVKDTRFLQKENKNADDDKWIYLPALRSTRRVASSEGDKSFVGTDFTYDDMSTREVEEDTHELLKESETKNGFDCYVVKSVPLDKNNQYLYRISWVDKKTMIPVYIEMYDKKEKLQKINTIKSIEERTGNKTYNIPMEMQMDNVQTGHSTTLKILNIEVDKPLAEGYFSPNFLNTGRL
ncbi:outer membrane lipoprotein-sorting protein [Treponema parvum]|uniref:Outer membrane lipoprotein-sorting protein n=1 Tax=Treponema parvum TaxID=138851 RepID=A0A975F3I3_9SPIR|nr:outer membrane lipoprotein-sorting protein [Treponema parvum]QTQ13807.1 outer membrane lipoprotein-sorting protein [Treponema parvum]